MDVLGGSMDVVVVGAGVAGLSCAAALAGAGMRVVVLEADARPGGRAASWSDAATGETVDIGAHVVTSEHRNFLALLARLGTVDDICWQPQPLITLLDARRRLRMRSSRLPPPLHGLPNLPNALRCVSLGDLLSNLRVAWQAARLDEPSLAGLDQETALDYLRRHGVSERFIRWFWASAVLALLNVSLAECSAASMMRVTRWLFGRSGYCFGFPATGLADLFVPGCRRIIEGAGGAVLTSTAVREVMVEPDGRLGGFVLHDGCRVPARTGVLSLPPQALVDLKVSGSERLASLMQQARSFRPVRYLSTLLWFDRKLTRERFWSRVLADGDLNTDFYDLSNIREDGQGGSASLIASNAIDVSRAWAWSDEAVVERTRLEIEEFVGPLDGAKIVHARVHRIPLAVSAPAAGTEQRRPSCESDVPGLWLAGDWTATALPCSMESAARSGALAAEAIAAAAGRRLHVAQPLPETQGLFALLQRRPG